MVEKGILLVSSLQALTKSFNNAVEGARKEFEASNDIYQFLKFERRESGIQKMSRLFTTAVYGCAQCMKKLGVCTRTEMEKLWEKHLGNPDVKEAVDTFMEAEKSWLEFVAEVDSKLSIEEDKLTTNTPASIGKQLPKDFCFIDASSGHPANLEVIWEESKYTLFMYVRHFG